MKKKILTLTVSKQWFDKIVSGEKTEEYREIKAYWVARLFHNNSNIIDVRYLASALAGRTESVLYLGGMQILSARKILISLLLERIEER